MNSFIQYVLYELRNSIALIIPAGILAAIVILVSYLLFKKKYKGDKKFPFGRIFLYLLFVGYLLIVVYATFLRGYGGYRRELNLHLFRAWREAWNNFSAKNWLNVLLNIAMFVPLGILLPLLGKKLRKWYLTIPAGFAVSLVIELLQLWLGRGICDVDDLFCNTLGAMTGYFAIMTILSLFAQKGQRLKPAISYGSLALASILAVCSVFFVYELKEYGNLPNAASYRTDTGNVTWTVDCELSDEDSTAQVYQTQIRTLADCDSFAADFMKTVGASEYDITYYQEAAYYMDHSVSRDGNDGSHFLFVDYLDTSYEYSCGFADEEVWVDGDRETVEAALAVFPVMLPDFAEFSVEGDGWHSFSVSQYIDGATMTDGVLRCRLEADGTVRKIENELLTYTYHKEEKILTPADAFEKITHGDYFDMNRIVHYSPNEVILRSYQLGYKIDTKGFYQPVYYFHLESPDGKYQTDIMIPAMK